MIIKYDYSGYRVLVTGGTSGIGLSAARMYHEAGADVTITGTKSPENYDVDLSTFSFKQMDLEDNASIDEFFKAGKAHLNKGPIALIFAEDQKELASTIIHHTKLGFVTIIVFARSIPILS